MNFPSSSASLQLALVQHGGSLASFRNVFAKGFYSIYNALYIHINCAGVSTDTLDIILLLQMAGECVDLRVNYDKLPSFVENSLGQAKFWQIVRQFVETLQVGEACYFEKKLVKVEGN